MANPKLRLVAPDAVNGTVGNLPPPRRKNAEVRKREHLFESEVNALIAAAKDRCTGSRNGKAAPKRDAVAQRDALAILCFKARRSWAVGLGVGRDLAEHPPP